MEDWTSIKTVLTVVQLGSLSAASKALGIHHTTVQRQISTLESQLQVKLFERQANRYVATQAGKILAEEANVADTHLKKAIIQIQAIKELNAGVLVITTIPECTPLLTEVVAAFQRNGPDVSILIRSDERINDLDRGEAQIGIRAGRKPTQPDYVVQLLERTECTLCAHKDYMQSRTKIASLTAIDQHLFVMSHSEHYIAPEMRWINDNIPERQIVLKTNNYASFVKAVFAGLGVGPLPLRCIENQSDVIPILDGQPPDEWATDIWIVTHIDKHWSNNVQNFLTFFKQYLASEKNNKQPRKFEKF